MKDSNDVIDSRDKSGEAGSIAPSMLPRVKAQEPEAWRRLVRLYGPVVYGWCRRAGLRDEDAADVGQDVFHAVATGVANFRRERPGDTFRGWLWGITRHKIDDHWRRRGVQPVALGGTAAQQRLLEIAGEQSGDSACSMAADDEGGLLRRALELIRTEFENRTWEAFWRVAVDGHAPVDVARDLGMSAGAVYIAKSRVFRRVREELGDLID